MMSFSQLRIIAESILPYAFRPWSWAGNAWDIDHIPDLSGKVAIVTGGNKGIGLETCTELVRNGAHVFMGCRSFEKFTIAKAYLEDLMEQRPNMKDQKRGQLSYLECDLSCLRTAKRAAKHFLEAKIGRLDIFFACAGIPDANGAIRNEDGLEPVFAINCVNHLALLNMLLPLIKKTSTLPGNTSSSRIVFVSSISEAWSSLPAPLALRPTFTSWDNVNDARRGGRGRYSQSKLGQILTIKRLNWELGNDNIACLALHPGEVDTDFVKRMIPEPLYPYITKLVTAVLLTPREAARTGLFAATAKEVDERKLRGVFLTHPCTVANPSLLATDMCLAQKLWDMEMDLIAANKSE